MALAGAGLLILSLMPPAEGPGDGLTPSPAISLAATDEPEAYGRALFQAKGCVGCHSHTAVNLGSGVAVGPELSSRSYDPDFLRSWLKDPGRG